MTITNEVASVSIGQTSFSHKDISSAAPSHVPKINEFIEVAWCLFKIFRGNIYQVQGVFLEPVWYFHPHMFWCIHSKPSILTTDSQELPLNNVKSLDFRLIYDMAIRYQGEEKVCFWPPPTLWSTNYRRKRAAKKFWRPFFSKIWRFLAVFNGF